MARDDAPLSNVMVDILLALAREPRHGYGIKLDIEERIGDGFVLGSSSLYQALQRLERRGFVAEVPGVVSEDDRRGRTYRITDAGTERLGVELERMHRVLGDARGASVDFSERAS